MQALDELPAPIGIGSRVNIVFFRGSTHEADGATRMLVQLANELSNRGHKVTILRWKYRKQHTFFPLDGSIGLEHVKPSGTRQATRHSRRLRDSMGDQPKRLSWLYALLRDPVGKVLLPVLEAPRIASSSTLSRLYYRIWRRYHAAIIGQYRRQLSRISPDVVATFFTRAHFYAAEACRQLSVPVVCSMHSDPSAYTKRLGGEFEHLIREIPVSRITILDESFLDKLPHTLVEQVRVIPNWIDTGRFYTNSEVCRSKRIIAVGRLVEAKNHELLIDAWAQLAGDYPDWSVDIFGTGPLEAKLHAQINRLGLSSSVRLREPRDSIQIEYADSSIHVMPSLWEGFGLALVEAMASGLPSIVLDVCEPPARLVRESQAGLVCARSPSALATSIRQLINSGELRMDMGINGATYAAQFTDRAPIDKFEAQLEAAWASSLSRQSPSKD